MRKKPTAKQPYFTMESAMTAILRDASGKMHHGILFDRRLDSLTKLWTLDLVWTWTLDLVFFFFHDFTYLQCNLKMILSSLMYIFGWSP